MMLPLAIRSRHFYEWQAVGMLVGAVAGVAWLIAPVAIWMSLGVWWILPWLLATSYAVVGICLARRNAGNGG